MSPDVNDELAALRNEVSRLAAQQRHNRLSARKWAVTVALCVAGAALAQPVIVSFTADTPAVASDINSSLESLRDWSVPRGAVLFFDGATCPTGWSTVASAQGRLIMGRPSAGTLGRTFGGQVSGDSEPGHGHATSGAGAHTHTGVTSGWVGWITNTINYNIVPGYMNAFHIQEGLLINGVGDHAHGVTTTGASAVLPYVYFTPCRKD
jgi:hypothetical protein